MHDFQGEFLLPYSVEKVFEFHSQPVNLQRMFPEDAQAKMVDAPEELATGSEFELHLKVSGLGQQLRFRVTEFAPPNRIVDEQIKGPFKKWIESHHFKPTDGGTLLVYEVNFVPPGGMLGMMVTPARVLAHLEESMPFREQRTRELLADF